MAHQEKIRTIRIIDIDDAKFRAWLEQEVKVPSTAMIKIEVRNSVGLVVKVMTETGPITT